MPHPGRVHRSQRRLVWSCPCPWVMAGMWTVSSPCRSPLHQVLGFPTYLAAQARLSS